MEIRVTLASPGPLPDPLVQAAASLGTPVCVETRFGQACSVLGEHPDPATLRAELLALSDQVAVGVVTGPLAHSSARLLLLDVDSTLTTTEAIDLLAQHAGVGEQVAAITERAMRGELDFATSLRERVATLRGLPTAIFHEVAPAMTLSPGARELIVTAKKAGAAVGVTSGGFSQLVEPLARQLGLDFFNANQLETTMADGVELLTGRVVGTVVDAAQKARDLRRFAQIYDVDPQLCVAVGDGANDLKMFEAAGLSIAYCAKPITAAQADISIRFARLDAVAAFAFGLSNCR